MQLLTIYILSPYFFSSKNKYIFFFLLLLRFFLGGRDSNFNCAILDILDGTEWMDDDDDDDDIDNNNNNADNNKEDHKYIHQDNLKYKNKKKNIF